MDQLTTVTKALRVLQAFTYERPVLGVSELARELGMGKSSVHRILTTLAEQGFVAKTTDDRYRLGLKLHELGQLVVSSLELREVAHSPSSDSATRRARPCIWPSWKEPMSSTSIGSSHRRRCACSRVGRRIPAHTTSSGKCLLAFSPPAAVEVVLAAGLKRVGPRTITSRAAFLDALAKIRANGYTVSTEENERGVVSVGAPVFGHDRTCVAAISMAGPMLRMTPERIPALASSVRRCARSAPGWGSSITPTAAHRRALSGAGT
ncbi:MAG: IclR family transcriptional regulator [Ilumatobacteraceae bacterium]